jgi:predicted phage gp36 major capsid-like protein
LQQLINALIQYQVRQNELTREKSTLEAALRDASETIKRQEKQIAAARERIEYKTVEEWEREQASHRNDRDDRADAARNEAFLYAMHKHPDVAATYDRLMREAFPGGEEDGRADPTAELHEPAHQG